MRRRLVFTFVAFVYLVAGAPVAHAQVIGKAGAVELTEADVRRMLAGLPGETRVALVADDAALDRFVRNELARRLMLADARAQSFERDPAALAELERLREEALLRAWLERQAVVPSTYPSDAEVASAYQAATARQPPAFEYRLAQIYVAIPDGATPAKVAEALKKVGDVQTRVGGDFTQLAKQYSEHAESASRGGDLGSLPESSLLPEVRAAVKDLAIGAVAGPVKTAQGIHFVKLLEKKPLAVPSLADVRAGLVDALRRQRAAAMQREYLARIGAGITINVNQVELGKLRAALK